MMKRKIISIGIVGCLLLVGLLGASTVGMNIKKTDIINQDSNPQSNTLVSNDMPNEEQQDCGCEQAENIIGDLIADGLYCDFLKFWADFAKSKAVFWEGKNGFLYNYWMAVYHIYMSKWEMLCDGGNDCGCQQNNVIRLPEVMDLSEEWIASYEILEFNNNLMELNFLITEFEEGLSNPGEGCISAFIALIYNLIRAVKNGNECISALKAGGSRDDEPCVAALGCLSNARFYLNYLIENCIGSGS